MKIKICLLLGSIALLSGCATLEEMRQEWIKQKCNPPAAYNQGMHDGLIPGALPQTNFASICPANNIAINRAYNRGFSEGLQSRPKEININQQVNVQESNKKRRH